MPFQPGVSANPNGRPAGSRNKRTKELLDMLEARGDKDPLDFLSDVITNGTDPALKVQAAGIAIKYSHSQIAATPAPRYFEHPVTVPDFNTVEDAESFLASIPQLLGSQQLDSQSAMELSTLTRNWLSAIYERDEMHLKMLNANATPGEHVIRIEGGLPKLPGTNTIMPDLNNGQRVNDSTLPLGPPDNGPGNGPCDPIARSPSQRLCSSAD
jgi:hypothetical protein